MDSWNKNTFLHVSFVQVNNSLIVGVSVFYCRWFLQNSKYMMTNDAEKVAEEEKMEMLLTCSIGFLNESQKTL